MSGTQGLRWAGIRPRLNSFFFMCAVLMGCLSLASLVSFTPAFAAEETLSFSTPEKKLLYQKMTREMRCLKCQNQNLADSPAGIAEDLKREIFLMVEEGRSAAHITDFMVARYGDFILYKPAIKPLTLFLWVAPFLLMAVGLFLVVKLSKRRELHGENTQTVVFADDAAVLQHARELLYSDGREDDVIAARSDTPTSSDGTTSR